MNEVQVHHTNILKINIDGHQTGCIQLSVVNRDFNIQDEEMLSEIIDFDSLEFISINKEEKLKTINNSNILPKFNKIEYHKIKLNKTKVELSDKDISKSVKKLAKTVKAAARWLANKYLEMPKAQR